ncbi:MAG: type I secretion C-terminal target domain-containing protein [Mesorhizobium sp.]|nr:MAG: type I secretion C-terminal target domain-containing protein [Mesorhizobium sp.]
MTESVTHSNQTNGFDPNDTVPDNFSITVTDVDGDSASTTFAVAIVDDVPTAVADIDSIAAGQFGPATGNVLVGGTDGGDANATDGVADTKGADGATVVGVQAGNTNTDVDNAATLNAPIQGSYGTLTLLADGSYSYVRAAGTPGGVNDVFTYTIKDGDGDTSHTTLTISIGNSTPVITDLTPEAIGGDVVVNEAALNIGTPGGPGSDPASTAETGAGTFTISSPDGINSLAIDGNAFITNGVFTAGSFTTAFGNTLNVTAYNAATGQVSYTYTLLDNEAHAAVQGTNDLFENFTVTLTDQDLQSANATLSVKIVDDVPTASNEASQAVAEGAPAVTGTLDFVAGADGATVTHVNGTLLAFDPGTGYSQSIDIGAGSIQVKADGSYAFTPDASVDNSSGPVAVNATYTVTDGDLDTSTANIAFTITDGAGPVAGAPITLALDDQNLSDGSTPAGPDSALNSITFTPGSDAIASIAFGTDLSGLNSANLTWTRVSDTQVVGKDGAVTVVTLDLSVANNVATVTATLNNNYDAHPGINLDDLVNLGQVGVVATDSDGDQATGTVNVTVSDDVPTASSDIDVAQSGQTVVGNVETNDTAGADGIASIAWTNVAGSTVTGTYGVLTVDANGGYSYHANPNASGVDIFNYTITDGDGDTSPSTLTITVSSGTPQPVAVTLTVDEAALDTSTTGDDIDHGTVTGTNPSSTAETVTGTLTLGDPDSPHVTNIAGATSLAVGGSPVTVQGTYGVLQIDQDGHYTYTLTTPFTTAPATDNGAATEPGKDVFTYTVTDSFGNSSTSTISVDIIDDVPTISAPGASNSLTVDETVLATNDTQSFAGAFTSSYGADGAGAISYALGFNAGATGLVDTASGQAVVLSLEAGQVVGRAGIGGAIVFTVTTDASGNVTLDQQRAVVHPTANANEPVSLNADNLVTLTATITDKDGDSSAATLNIGQNLTFLDDGPAFTLVNDGNGDGIVSLSALNPATATTYTGQFAEWNYGADGFGSVTATGPNVEVASTSASQIVLNLKEGGDVVAKLTLNADGTDSLEVLHRAGDIVFSPIAATSATAGGPTGSLLVDLGAATNFNIVVTGDDGNATLGQASDEVNTSSQGWAVKGSSGQSNDPGESIKFAFVDDSNNSTGHGVDDFKFTTQGYTGGMGTAHITVVVYLNAQMTIYDTVSIDTTSGQVIQISNLNWSAAAGTGNYVSGDAIYGVKVISDNTNTGGFRLNGVEVGAASENPPADLDFNGINVMITDHDGDTASQTFNVHIDGTTGSQLTVEAIAGTSGNDILAGTAIGETLVGGAGNDTICGAGGNDVLIGGLGADQFRLATNTGTDIVKDLAQGTDKIALLDTGSTGTGSVNFVNTIGTSAGTALNASDFSIRASISALTAGDSTHIVRIDAAQTSAQIAAVTAAVAANTYVLVFNSTTAHGELWFDANWNDAAGRTQVATFDNITTLGQLTTLTSADFVVYDSATDPIILDLNHDGFAFSDLSHGVQFDINGDGTKDQVAWNSSNDGMLAVDLNHDGKIDDGTELFTPNFGGGNFASGAAALASLDSNHDGLIDHNDTAFDSLLIWKDANANGASDAGELSHLADNGIVSISTAATPTVGEIDGQTVTGNGTFHMADGTTGNYVEVELDTSLVAPAEPTAGTAGADTFKLDNLDIKDLITDYHGTGPGGEGDKIDLSALFDTAPGGDINDYVHYDAETKTLSVDTTGSGNAANFVDVAALQNAPAAGTITILYDDTAHVQHTATI